MSQEWGPEASPSWLQEAEMVAVATRQPSISSVSQLSRNSRVDQEELVAAAQV